MLHDLANSIASYRPNDAVRDLLARTRIVLMVGVSGAGKDTLKAELLKTGRYHHIVSHTTRPPRLNNGVPEQNGVEYHFIDAETAARMLDNHAFIEAKWIHNSDVYGTSVAEIQMAHDEGKVAITDLDVQGVEEYVRLAPNVKPVFILPPNFDVWQARLHQRYGNRDHDEIAKRLQTAKGELQNLLGSRHFYAVINRDLPTAVAEIDRIAQLDTPPPPLSAEARDLAQDLLNHL